MKLSLCFAFFISSAFAPSQYSGALKPFTTWGPDVREKAMTVAMSFGAIHDQATFDQLAPTFYEIIDAANYSALSAKAASYLTELGFVGCGAVQVVEELEKFRGDYLKYYVFLLKQHPGSFYPQLEGFPYHHLFFKSLSLLGGNLSILFRMGQFSCDFIAYIIMKWRRKALAKECDFAHAYNQVNIICNTFNFDISQKTFFTSIFNKHRALVEFLMHPYIIENKRVPVTVALVNTIYIFINKSCAKMEIIDRYKSFFSIKDRGMINDHVELIKTMRDSLYILGFYGFQKPELKTKAYLKPSAQPSAKSKKKLDEEKVHNDMLRALEEEGLEEAKEIDLLEVKSKKPGKKKVGKKTDLQVEAKELPSELGPELPPVALAKDGKV